FHGPDLLVPDALLAVLASALFRQARSVKPVESGTYYSGGPPDTTTKKAAGNPRRRAARSSARVLPIRGRVGPPGGDTSRHCGGIPYACPGYGRPSRAIGTCRPTP